MARWQMGTLTENWYLFLGLFLDRYIAVNLDGHGQRANIDDARDLKVVCQMVFMLSKFNLEN